MNRMSYWIAGTLALLVLGASLILHFATRSVQHSIEKALGPAGEAAEINARLTSIELVDVVIDAPPGWPAKSSLRADRILIKPDIGYFLSDHIHIRRVDVENGYLSAVRPKGGGGLRVLPTIAERERKAEQDGDAKAARRVTIDTLALAGATIEIFDASAGAAQKLRIVGVGGTLENIQTPALDARTGVDLRGKLGASAKGGIAIAGWVNVAGRDAELAVRMRGVDLAPFRGYVGDGRGDDYQSGVFHLDLDSRVRDTDVQARGTLTIESLELAPSDSPLEALARLPRKVALGTMENDRGQIVIPFTVSGEIDDPAFDVSDEKLTASLTKSISTGLGGIARAFLIMVNGLAGSFRALVPG